MGLSYFNYRLVEKENYFKEKYYEVHEVYYSRRGKITSWSAEPISISVENLEELKNVVRHIRDAGRKNVLKVKGKQLVDTGKKMRRKKKVVNILWGK